MFLFRWPNRQDWLITLLGITAFAAVAVPFALLSGIYTWTPDLLSRDTLRVAVVALVLPALMEELVFRGPLVWWQQKRGHVPNWLVLISLAAFVAWHPINAFTFMPQAAEIFLNWRFLAVTSVFGALVTLITLRSRSLWPAILFHWLLVVAWKGLFGAPSFL
ncbi:MAG: CPBP family glutamic-type intramembrane protease [Pseudomonadota bacterium]